MKIKDLRIGDRFHTLNNKGLILIRGNEVLVGRRHLIACKSPIGMIKLSPELDVVKC